MKLMSNHQYTIWDIMNGLVYDDMDVDEPEVGEFRESHGAVICHIMRPNYIGKKVMFDCGTESMPNLCKCGILEKYIPYEGTYRSIIFTGKKQRSYITHYPGREIYECLPWEKYPERINIIYGKVVSINDRVDHGRD